MRKKSKILNVLAVVLLLVVSVECIAYADDMAIKSQGRIVFDNNTTETSDDVIFDASDLTTLDTMVKTGKSDLAEALNEYPNTAVPALDTFDNLATAICSLTVVPEIYYYNKATEGDACARYIYIDGLYYPCDQYGVKTSETALSGTITVVTKDDTTEAAEGETLLVKYEETAAENLSAGFAGYADKEFILGSGSDNIEYRNSGNSKAIVFTSFPVDMSQYTDRWAELTSKDFKAGITGFQGGVYGVDPREDSATANGLLNDGSFTITKDASSFNYNSKTGELSFSNPTYSQSNNANSYTVDVSLNLRPTSRFVVWLGTVNGE